MKLNFFLTLTTCCGMFSMRTGAFIIGSLELFVTVSSYVVGEFFAFAFSSYTFHLGDTFLPIDVVFFLAGAFDIALIIGTCVMLIGISKRRPNLIFQWIVQEVIAMFFMVLSLLVSNFESYPYEDKILSSILGITWIVFKWYQVSVVHSYYQLLRNPAIDDAFGTEHTSWRQLRDKNNIQEENGAEMQGVHNAYLIPDNLNDGNSVELEISHDIISGESK